MLEWNIEVEESVVLAGDEIRLVSTLRNTAEREESGTENGSDGDGNGAGNRETAEHGDWDDKETPNSNVTRPNGSAASESGQGQEQPRDQSGEHMHVGERNHGAGSATATTTSSLRPVHFERRATDDSGSAAKSERYSLPHHRRAAPSKARALPPGTETIACAIMQVVCRMAGNPNRVDMHKSQQPTNSYSFAPAAGTCQVRLCACVRACVCACACVRACVCVCVLLCLSLPPALLSFSLSLSLTPQPKRNSTRCVLRSV